MTDINLDGMDPAELKALEKKVATAITSFETRRKTEARAAAEAKANELGFTLSELMDGTKTKAPKGVAKYAHPQNPSLTWTGRGRKPNWFIEALEAGMTEGDLLV